MSLFEQYFSERSEFADLELTLRRVNQAVKEFGPIPDDVKVVHIAGTNGKGSTAYMLSQMLTSEKASVILFPSPHMETIRERIQLNNTPVSSEIFDRLFSASESCVKKYRLSYFETLFLMCWIYCLEVKPDFLILETGLGGRYDATNTDEIKNKTPVITTISQDHKHILGSNIFGILDEKLAIAGNNNPVFIGRNHDFIYDEINIRLPGRDLRFLNKDLTEAAAILYSSPFHYNYTLAHMTAEHLLQMPIPVTKKLLPPCRHEAIGRVIFDGAHNVSGLLTLLDSFDTLPCAAIVGSTADRDIKRFCTLLSGRVRDITLTTIPKSERSYSTRALKEIGYTVIADPEEALKTVLNRTECTVLVTGSLYLCAYLRKNLNWIAGQARNDEANNA